MIKIILKWNRDCLKDMSFGDILNNRTLIVYSKSSESNDDQLPYFDAETCIICLWIIGETGGWRGNQAENDG